MPDTKPGATGRTDAAHAAHAGHAAVPPSPAQATRVLVWMCVIIAINQLGFGALIPVLPLYAQSFGVSVSAIGTAIAIYGLARFAAAIPTGRAADRFGRRPSLAMGGLVSALGNLWCGMAGSFPEFLAGRFVAGAGAAIVMTAGSVILADISTPAQRGRTMAIYQSAFLFAVGIGPWPGGWLAEHFGLQAPFQLYALAGLLAGVVAWFAVPETRQYSIGRGAHAPALSFLNQQRLLLRHTGFLLVCLISLVNAVVRTGALFNVVPILGAAKLGLTPGQIGTALALGGVLGLLASYPAGALADAYGRKPVIVPSTIITGASMLAFLFAPDYFWFVVACVVWGTAIAVSGAGPAAYAADSAPPGMNAAAISSFRMIGDIGYVVGPIALGLLTDGYGAAATLWASALMVVTVGLLFARYAPETHRP